MNLFRTFPILVIFCLGISANAQKIYPLTRNDSAMLVEYNQASINHKNNGALKESSDFLNKSAMLYWERNHFDDAEKKFLESLEINKTLANQNGIAMINNNLAMIYADKKDFKKSLSYFEETLAARRVGKEKIGIISALINQSVVYNHLKEYKNSITNLKEALDLAREMNDPKQMRSCYGMLSETYQKSGNTKESLYYYEYFKTFNDFVTEKTVKKSYAVAESERLKREVAELAKLNKELELQKTEKKLKKSTDEVKVYSSKQKELLATLTKQEMSMRIIKQESTIKDFENKQLKIEKNQQFLVITFISIALALILIFAIFMVRLYRQKLSYSKLLLQKNQEIFQQKEEIMAQNDELEFQKVKLQESNAIINKKNKSITQSINYAYYIQKAMLNRSEKLTDFLPNSFILYRPRDVVSGDFFWYAKIKHRIFIIAADCTGHGVPGAFISMIGNNILTNVIGQQKVYNPAKILTRLNEGVIEALNQNSSNNTDGMDISVCIVDTKNKKLKYAGAKSPIIVFQNGIYNYIRPDSTSVGGVFQFRRKQQKSKDVFNTKEISFESESITVYQFSDGIVDQFNGENKKKYTRKRLQNTLQKIQDIPMPKQKEILLKEIADWQQENHQTDDITILGYKIG